MLNAALMHEMMYYMVTIEESSVEIHEKCLLSSPILKLDFAYRIAA
jgi:hypothetical protein